MDGMTLDRLRHDLRESAVSFLRWWGAELYGLLPARVRAALARRSGKAVADLTGPTARIWRPSTGWRPLGEKKAKALTGLRADIVIADDDVFRKRIVLPRMSPAQAKAALALQLNRHVPFHAADVVHDCRVVDESNGNGTVTAELAVVRKLTVEEAADRLRAHGLEPRRIGLLLEGVAPSVTFNLRSGTGEADRTARRLHGLLAALAAVLALATLFVAEDRRAAELGAYARIISDSARRAAETRKLQDRVADLEAKAAFLAAQWAHTARIRIIDDLTKALPDGTWLDMLELNGGKFHLTGYSAQASAVPEQLQKAGFTDVSFRAGLSSTVRPGVDRFDVEGRFHAD